MSDGDYSSNSTSSTSSSTFDSTEGISCFFVLFSFLLATTIVLSKLLHDRPRLASILPEAGMILIVGIVAGSVINIFVAEHYEYDAQDDDQAVDGNVAELLLSFSPEVFFMALLPPIIFNSGYHLRRELFFRHIVPIVLFAVAGTLISAISIAFLLDFAVGAGLTGGFKPHMTELLTFGALISATDPVSTLAVFQAKRVDPHLFYLVFGESVLNDAMGLVLFKAFSAFVKPPNENNAGKIAFSLAEFIVSFLLDAIGSPVLGVLCGVGAALLFKHIDMRKSKLLELSLYVLIMYVPFLFAELVRLSGIVTILFTGMTARSFVVPNLSSQTAATGESLFRLAAHLAETAIFLELGLSVFSLTQASLRGKFVAWAILACLVGRALNIYPITFLFNRMLQRDTKAVSNDDDVEGNLSPIGDLQQDNSHKVHIEMRDGLASLDHHQAEEMFRDANNDPQIQHQDTDLSSITPRKARDMKIKPKTANMLWFSGLRGAVAYACVRSFPNTFGHRNEFTVTTMVIVLVTVFALGGTTEMTLKLLKIHMNVDEAKYMEEWHNQREPHSILLKLDEVLNHFLRRRDDDQKVIYETQEAEKARMRPLQFNHDLCHLSGPIELSISLFDFGGSDFFKKD